MMVEKILLILGIHFVADFLLQTSWMAVNKSKDYRALSLHVFVYHLPFYFFGYQFAISNMYLHLVIDFFTSRLTSYLWIKEKRHAFFVVIGLDQYLHAVCLILTAKYFGVFIGVKTFIKTECIFGTMPVTP